MPLSLTITGTNESGKVGDTLTATVTGAAVEKYEWTLNGKGAVTTEEYEVPADAKSGDKIKLVVTAEDGETAEDTVYVGGFTITKVEPTTDAAATATGYKYIRAYFSSSLATLTADDIEIRNKDTEQLYSIDTVKLSSDGTYADITLFGSVQEGNTKFLQGGEIYVMAITNDGVSDSYEFELPIVDSDVLVTNVDIANGKIHLAGGQIVNAGDYEVGDVYEDNLGTLVGRTVNVGVNSDNEIEKLSVRKANVVTGVMKYVDKGTTDKSYFEDQATKSKYYLTSNSTTTTNPTVVIEVVSGDFADFEDGTTFDYAKLVLNSNSTVACAVVDPDAWVDTVKVADVDGTIVSETTKVNVDFDGYTIEKNGEYVTTADLEVDDVIFYEGNGDEKFAEVYTVVVDGEPSDIDSTSIAIDGTAYKWTYEDAAIAGSAKYYDTENDVYTPLDEITEVNANVEAQKYLKSLDADLGVIAYLDRLGNIAYLDGIVEESAVTTDTWYVTTSAGAGYSQALASYLKFKVSDGTEQTIEIPTSQIKKFNGVKVKKIEGAAGAEEDGSDFEFTLTADEDTDNEAFGAAIEAQYLVESGVLVKLTRDESGNVIGIAFGGTYKKAATTAEVPYNDVYPLVEAIDGEDKALKPGVAKVTTDGGTTAKLTDDTVIWVYTHTISGGEDKGVKVTKTTFDDYTRTTEKVSVLNAIQDDDNPTAGPFVQVKGSSVTDVLLRETIEDEDSDVFVAGETSTVEGIVTGFSTKKKSGDDENYVYSVTLLTQNGDKITYDALDESLAIVDADKDNYVVLKLDKATGDISSKDEANSNWTDDGELSISDCTSTKLVTIDEDVIKLDSSALVLKKSGSTYTKIKLNQIAASTKRLHVKWHDEYLNTETDPVEHYADFVVVEEFSADELLEEERAAAVDAIGLANDAFEALDGDEESWADWEEKAEAASDAIAEYVDDGGAATAANLGDGFTDFTAYTEIDGDKYIVTTGNLSAVNTSVANGTTEANAKAAIGVAVNDAAAVKTAKGTSVTDLTVEATITSYNPTTAADYNYTATLTKTGYTFKPGTNSAAGKVTVNA